MKIQKTVYWIATILVCILLLYSASMYLSKTEMVEGFYKALNYPTYLVIPMAIVKILAVIMMLWRSSSWLTEWAYAGVFFDFVLAFFAHYHADDGGITLPLLGLVVLLISYFFGKELRS